MPAAYMVPDIQKVSVQKQEAVCDEFHCSLHIPDLHIASPCSVCHTARVLGEYPSTVPCSLKPPGGSSVCVANELVQMPRYTVLKCGSGSPTEPSLSVTEAVPVGHFPRARVASLLTAKSSPHRSAGSGWLVLLRSPGPLSQPSLPVS